MYVCMYYCTSVWGSTYQSNLKRLITLQERVITIISKSTFDAHTNPTRVQSHFLKRGILII